MTRAVRRSKPMDKEKIVTEVGITLSMLNMIFAGKAKPSPRVARLLEKATKIDRLAWLYPEEYPNEHIKKANGNDAAA